MHDDLEKLAKSISKFCVGAEGNVSGRVDDSVRFIIKSSGSQLDNMKLSDWVMCDHDGRQLTNFDKTPSIELDFHRYLFDYSKEIKFIAHSHPMNTVGILCSEDADVFSYHRLFPDQVVFNGVESCLVPFYIPGEKLAMAVQNSIEKFFKNFEELPSLVLLKNHGIIVFGRTIEECVIKTSICEKAAEIFNKTTNHVFLPKGDIYSIHNNDKEIYRRSICS